MVIYELFCLFEEVLIGMTGFEPAASSSRTKRATGLRYIPQFASQKYLYRTNNQIVLVIFIKCKTPGFRGFVV